MQPIGLLKNDDVQSACPRTRCYAEYSWNVSIRRRSYWRYERRSPHLRQQCIPIKQNTVRVLLQTKQGRVAEDNHWRRPREFNDTVMHYMHLHLLRTVTSNADSLLARQLNKYSSNTKRGIQLFSVSTRSIKLLKNSNTKLSYSDATFR